MTAKPTTSTSEPSLKRPPSDRELQARFGLGDQADPMQKRPKGWRRRIAVALVAMFVPGLLLFLVWPKVANQLSATSRLKSRGVGVEWVIDASNWSRGGATRVTSLGFWAGSSLTDIDLPYLKRLHRLEVVQLSAGAAVPRGRFPVGRPASGRAKSNDSNGVTPDGLVALEGLSDLKELEFCPHHGIDSCQGVHTTDAGLVHLRGLTQLEELSLSGSHITDDGLAELAPLTNLKSLDLDFTEITDAGLHHLLALKNLEILSLRETAITDEGMAVLARIPRLRTMNIEKTKVTPKGIFVVLRANPQADIYHEHTLDTFEKPEFVNSPEP
jgi:Leucine Rich Repeat (LRR) protein